MIPDPELRLAELEDVQKEVLTMLGVPLPGGPAPAAAAMEAVPAVEPATPAPAPAAEPSPEAEATPSA